jgi:hypothetical protein
VATLARAGFIFEGRRVQSSLFNGAEDSFSQTGDLPEETMQGVLALSSHDQSSF